MNDSGAADLARAEALIDLRRFADAKVILAAAGSRGAAPTSRGWCLMAQCELGLGSGAGSLWATEQALRLDPESEWAHRLRANALMLQQRYREAQLAAEESVRLAPWNYQGHASLASVHAGIPGRTLAGLAPAERAVELAPHAAEAHFIHGLALARAGRRRKARQAYRRALELEPDHASARNNLGVLALSAGRTTLASDHFTASVQLDPRSRLATSNLMLVYRVLLARLSLVMRLTFFAVLVGSADDSNSNATWPVGRLVGVGTGLVLVAAFVAWSGFLNSEQLRSMWRVPSIRWLFVPPAIMIVAIVILVLLPVSLLGWGVVLLLLIYSVDPYARRRSKALTQQSGGKGR